VTVVMLVSFGNGIDYVGETVGVDSPTRSFR
jgi:hypothetical protein